MGRGRNSFYDLDKEREADGWGNNEAGLTGLPLQRVDAPFLDDCPLSTLFFSLSAVLFCATVLSCAHYIDACRTNLSLALAEQGDLTD